MNELRLSQIWQAQWLRRDQLRTTDGRAVRIVYRGRWSHGLGPDFQDALLVFDDGPLLRGAIEVHLRAADWNAHGHQHDPRYAQVILHVTLDATPARCRRPDGQLVPHLALLPSLPAPVETFLPPAGLVLGAIGDGPCAGWMESLPPDRLLGLVRQAGLIRLRQKAATIEASYSHLEPDQSFYADLLDALGYSHNRQPFRALAALLPLARLDDLCYGQPADQARARLAALLLGVAGFLPWRDQAGLALRPAAGAELDQLWRAHGRPWHPPASQPPAWDLARVRPANHPARRLLGLAALLASGPAALPARGFDRLAVLSATPRRLVDTFSAALWPTATATRRPPTLIGPDRAGEIVINVLVPHALARAASGGDPSLAHTAETAARDLPAGADNAQTRAMLAQLGGPARLPIRSALEQQGLLHLYRTWCQARRCYECPVAAAVAPPPPLRPT